MSASSGTCSLFLLSSKSAASRVLTFRTCAIHSKTLLLSSFAPSAAPIMLAPPCSPADDIGPSAPAEFMPLAAPLLVLFKVAALPPFCPAALIARP